MKRVRGLKKQLRQELKRGRDLQRQIRDMEISRSHLVTDLKKMDQILLEKIR